MKYDELLRQIIMESILFLGVLLLLVGGVYYVNILHDDYEQQTSVLRRETEALQQETRDLQGKFLRVRENAGLYQEALDKKNQGRLSITRQGVRDKFDHYNDEYLLGNLRLTMSAIEEVQGSQYRRKNNVMIASDVNVHFEAVADEYVYDMLGAMQQQMAGGIKVTRVRLQRQRGLSDDVLRAISEKGTFPLVVGEIKFKWLGMKFLNVEESNAVELLK